METEERGALQEGEGDLVRENGDGSEDPDTGEDTVSTSDEKGEENVARDEEKVGTSVVDTAAPTDAVNSDHDPTVHHPLVRFTALAHSLICVNGPLLLSLPLFSLTLTYIPLGSYPLAFFPPSLCLSLLPCLPPVSLLVLQLQSFPPCPQYLHRQQKSECIYPLHVNAP